VCRCESLREAHDAFNQAAATENAQRFDANPAVSAASLVTVRSGYASALLSISKIDANDEKSLRADGLWGTALTLKALCEWRLGKFDQALDIANKEAGNSTAGQIFPRDRALLAALPGLIMTDQAYDKILNKKPLQEVVDLLTGPSGAIIKIQSARDFVDKDHPVQVYLIQAQLAAYRNYRVAQRQLAGIETIPVDNPNRKKAADQLMELKQLLKDNNPAPAGQSLILYWAALIGMSPPKWD